jgi:hypothetical protein
MHETFGVQPGSGVIKTDGAAAKAGGASKCLGLECFRGAQLTEPTWLSTDWREVGAMGTSINLSALLDDVVCSATAC